MPIKHKAVPFGVWGLVSYGMQCGVVWSTCNEVAEGLVFPSSGCVLSTREWWNWRRILSLSVFGDF